MPSPRGSERDLLTIREVAWRLSISSRSVWRLVATRELPPPVRLGRRVVRWRLADIRAYLDSLRTGTKLHE
jgi:excisionase family DNA binding protein